MIISSDAIVLRAVRYGDTSKIVTLYTRELGKVSVIAKGAMSARSRFGAALEPMSHSAVVFYRKESREVQTLSQADLIRQFRHLIESADKLPLGFVIVEFVHAALHGEEEHTALFDLVLEALTRIDEVPAHAENLLVRFLMDFSVLLGFGVHANACVDCSRALVPGPALSGPVRFLARDGGFTCAACARRHPGQDVEFAVLGAFQRISSAAPDAVAAEAVSTEAISTALRILHHHFSSHVEGLRRIHALELLPGMA